MYVLQRYFNLTNPYTFNSSNHCMCSIDMYVCLLLIYLPLLYIQIYSNGLGHRWMSAYALRFVGLRIELQLLVLEIINVSTLGFLIVDVGCGAHVCVSIGQAKLNSFTNNDLYQYWLRNQKENENEITYDSINTNSSKVRVGPVPVRICFFTIEMKQILMKIIMDFFRKVHKLIVVRIVYGVWYKIQRSFIHHCIDNGYIQRIFRKRLDSSFQSIRFNLISRASSAPFHVSAFIWYLNGRHLSVEQNKL